MVDVVNPVNFASSHSLGRLPAASGIASNHSASSSKSSLNFDHDDENDTITAKRTITRAGDRSQEDLHLLAVSAQITEISYSISDIQTRIFEIQELRHQTSSASTISNFSSLENSPPSLVPGSSGVIDQALINLDERLEVVSRSVDSVEEGLAPILRSVKTPTQNQSENIGDADLLILRKHTALMRDWEAVQAEAEVLREELKEDKWLTVFRSVSEQADGMMRSLEKAVTQCQEFIWQVNMRRPSEATIPPPSNTSSSDQAPINLEVYTNIHNSFESKKKYYMPSVTKILSVVDKGVRDRVTKNGECLRLHAEMRGRWRNLRERINRIDSDMENVRRTLLNRDRTESESTTSRATSKSRNMYLDTPSPPRSRAPSSTSTLSRSISPFRKFAARVTRSGGRSTPTPKSPRLPSTEPASSLRERASVFFRNGHKATQSVSDTVRGPSSTTRSTDGKKQPWNNSTKVEPVDAGSTIKASQVKRPSAGQAFSTLVSMAGRRSVTPSSQASSRPWSPSNSTLSTPSTHMSPPNISRPSSRAASSYGTNLSGPRSRPRTPSQIPAPLPPLHLRSSSRMSDWDDNTPSTSIMQRAFSPTQPKAADRAVTPHYPRASMIPTPRTPNTSISHIPVPSLSISRPASAMSNHSTASSVIARAQTPESSIRARAQLMPFYQSSGAGRSRPGPSKGPPSSFRDTSSTPTSAVRSRPPSRNAFTPSLEQNPVPAYIPGNMKDPLDVEVARVVNSIAHGFLIERVDPPLRAAPKPGEEVKAQYAISNALGRKILNCRLVVINRPGSKSSPGGETKKVMCRVGGGWQDLSMYLLNHAAGGAS